MKGFRRHQWRQAALTLAPGTAVALSIRLPFRGQVGWYITRYKITFTLARW